MSKRKAGEGLPFGMKSGKAVRFDDNVQESEEGFIGPGPLPAERKKEEGEDLGETPSKQHTLDSDEEDNEEEATKYDVMTEDDVEGQEDETVDFDDGEKITPFNMKEEMEEGHFDKQGNYFFKKDADIKDAWLDNVDWKKIRRTENAEKEKEGDDGDDDEGDDDDDDDANLEDYTPSIIGWKEKIPLYEEITSLMQPGENVFKAIKRLGGDQKGKTSSADRWKKKKQSETSASEDSALAAKDPNDAEASNKESMLRLTALADQLLQSGDLGIYESTVEKLKHELERNRPQKTFPAAAVKSLEADDDDDALDMFADEIDADKLNAKSKGKEGEAEGKSEDASAASEASSTEGVVAQDFSHEVHWWYRWEKSHSAEEHGPFPSTQMKTWTDLGYFPNGVWLRKDEQEVKDDLGNLYNSERIDFELYT